MLVRVKMPPTEIRLRGKGSLAVYETLRAIYREVWIEDGDEDESIVLKDTDWYKNIRAAITTGKSLRIYRKNAAMTLEMLSKKATIPKSHLSEMENDKRSIGKITAKKLAKALGCDYRSII